MRRREFITLLGGVATGWPLAVRAEHSVSLIGYLAGWPSDRPPRYAAAFHLGLKETGLVEGRDFAIERDRIAIPTARAATTAIPIVYIGGNDPVKIGLISSLNRPGGNVTGVTVLNVEIAAKR